MPARISLSAAAACSSARSSVRVTRQRSFGAYFFMRARYIFVRSTEETARERMRGASCVTGQNATSSRFSGGRARGGDGRDESAGDP